MAQPQLPQPHDNANFVPPKHANAIPHQVAAAEALHHATTHQLKFAARRQLCSSRSCTCSSRRSFTPIDIMGRLPNTDDFPASVKLNIVPPPNNDPPTNILILLHGLGDKPNSFTVLGGQMNLPETCCISVQGPANLLDLDGFHWGDDIIFDSTNGGLDSDAGFKKTNEILKGVVEDVLVDKCGYRQREVLLMGFGQGGMAALEYAAAQPSHSELGGIISIGAGLPSSSPASLDPKLPTPVLICAGSAQSSAVTSSSEDKLKRIFEHVEIKRYRRPGDTMPSNRDEMLPVMQFLSRRLRSTKGVPEGSVEVGA